MHNSARCYNANAVCMADWLQLSVTSKASPQNNEATDAASQTVDNSAPALMGRQSSAPRQGDAAPRSGGEGGRGVQ